MGGLLARYLRPYLASAVAAPFLMALEVAMDLLQPHLMARIVDAGVMAGDLGCVVRTGGWMLACAALGWAGGAGCSACSSHAAVGLGADLREALFDRIQALPLARLRRLGAASLVARVTNDVPQFQQFAMMLLRVFVRAPLLALGSLAMIALISPRLALVVVAGALAAFAVLVALGRRAMPLFARAQAGLDALNAALDAQLAGTRVIRAHAREDTEQARFGALNRAHAALALRAWRTVMLNAPLLMLLLNGTIVAVLWLGGRDSAAGGIAAGDLVALVNYVTIMMAALTSLGMLLMQYTRARVAAERVAAVFSPQDEDETAASIAAPAPSAPDADARPTSHTPHTPHTSPMPAARAPARIAGALEFEHVCFAHPDTAPGELLLDDVSFAIAPGETVALIGWTGAGKSTLAALLARIHAPTAGRVRIDGIDVRDLDPATLCAAIGFVPQETVLFSGSIRDNIRYGRPDASDEEVLRAARIAQADAFVAALPEGYGTRIGQGGTSLSGGQRQRLAIARALLPRPPILVLDDATSALDTVTERRLYAALRAECGGCTRLVISQRPAALRDADRVLVLDGGRIVAAGTHDELMRASALYREFVALAAHAGGAHA